MILHPRDVIQIRGKQLHHCRVVWADHRDIWLFDLDAPKAQFIRADRTKLENDLDQARVVIVTDGRYNAYHVEVNLTVAQRNRRDALLSVIKPIVTQVPDIFDDRFRGRVVADVERNGIRSAKTVHSALDRWWRGGMTIDALVPAFQECGRGVRQGGAKRAGRKQPPGAPQGLVITPQIEKMFERSVKRYYANDRKNALTSVYEMMVAENFVDEHRDSFTGERSYVTKVEYLETGFPTLRQFQYWYSKHDDKLGIKRKRLGDANYEKDNRAIVGSAREHLFGIGSRFEIDATQLEQSVVSELFPLDYIDPPTFYQVVDVLSGLICGIYVGHETANWTSAGLAIRNVVEDKVEFAARYGVIITHDQWPCHSVLPARLLADNAEFKGELATDFTAKSYVTVENARALRGDMKGTVEGKFNLFKRELRKILPGYGLKNQGNPGGADHRRDAALTMKELTAAVIETVVLLNSKMMKTFKRNRAMIQAGVYAVPKDIWQWAESTGNSELTRFDVAAASLAMLPTAIASVTAKGIKFQGLYFAGPDLHDERFAIARQNGVSKVQISYDPLCADRIFVHSAKTSNRGPGAGYEVFTQVGTTYAGLSFEDIKMHLVSEAQAQKLNQFKQAELVARHFAATKDLSSSAKKKRSRKLSHSEVSLPLPNVSLG
jgi:hypothetical protein